MGSAPFFVPVRQMFANFGEETGIRGLSLTHSQTPNRTKLHTQGHLQHHMFGIQSFNDDQDEENLPLGELADRNNDNEDLGDGGEIITEVGIDPH